MSTLAFVSHYCVDCGAGGVTPPSYHRRSFRCSYCAFRHGLEAYAGLDHANIDAIRIDVAIANKALEYEQLVSAAMQQPGANVELSLDVENDRTIYRVTTR